MIRKTVAVLTLLTLICCSSVQADEKPESISANDPRARPLVVAILAVHYKDVELFKQVFSDEVKERIGENDWPRGLEAYTRELKDYTPEELKAARFQFTGDQKSGALDLLDSEGTSKGELRVIKENGVWKLNER